MRGAVLPLPNTSSYRGAYLSTEYVFLAWYLFKHMDDFISLELVNTVQLLQEIYQYDFKIWMSTLGCLCSSS
jgi:hypothetical protein